MMNLTQSLMIAAIAVTMIAVLQISASAIPLTTGTLSMTNHVSNVVMASDRDRQGRGNWRSGHDRDDNRFRGDSDWRPDRDRDWDRDHHDHDNNNLLLGAAVIGGLYLLTR